MSEKNFCYISGMRIDHTTYDDAVKKTISLVRPDQGGFVCIAAIHVVKEAYRNIDFRKIINSADLITPDGVSLVWGLRILGVRKPERVCGLDLMLLLLKRAEQLKIPVGFYGGSQQTIDDLLKNSSLKYPSLEVAYAYSPPFRPLTKKEDEKVIADILSSGAKILFIGLGCPKQEMWVDKHRKSLPIVMLSVGAAFDYMSGKIKRAPQWIQNLGFEWMFRLIQDPKRLWKRYIVSNPIFVYLVLREVKKRIFRR